MEYPSSPEESATASGMSSLRFPQSRFIGCHMSDGLGKAPEVGHGDEAWTDR